MNNQSFASERLPNVDSEQVCSVLVCLDKILVCLNIFIARENSQMFAQLVNFVDHELRLQVRCDKAAGSKSCF
jgi:hypothetical protein